MALRSTQPLTEMSTSSISWGKGSRCVWLTTYHHPVLLSWNLGTLTSWNPLDHSRPVTGQLLWRHIWIIVCHYLQALFLKQLFEMCCVLNSQTPPSTIRKTTNSASCWRNFLPLCNWNIQYFVHKSIPFSSLLSETGAGVHTSKHLNTFHSWKMATNMYWVTVSCMKIGTVKAILNPLNARLNPICHLLAFLEAPHILHISRIRVNFMHKWIFVHTFHICVLDLSKTWFNT